MAATNNAYHSETLKVRLMSEREDYSKTLKDVDEKLETIIRRLDYLEDLIAKYPEILQLADLMRILGLGARLSNEPVKAIRRLISLGKTVSRPGVELDETSQLIVQVLAVKGPLNLSQVTREIMARRGKASRKTIRKRMKALLDEGIVRKAEGYKSAYELVE